MHKRLLSAALLAAAMRDFSTDPVIALLSGSIAESEGRRNDAAALLRRALAGNPLLVEARLRLGRVLVTFANAPTALALGAELAGAIVAEANQVLRDTYGEAQLPEDVKPSEL